MGGESVTCLSVFLVWGGGLSCLSFSDHFVLGGRPDLGPFSFCIARPSLLPQRVCIFTGTYRELLNHVTEPPSNLAGSVPLRR